MHEDLQLQSQTSHTEVATEAGAGWALPGSTSAEQSKDSESEPGSAVYSVNLSRPQRPHL